MVHHECVCVITVRGVQLRHMGTVPTKWTLSHPTNRGNNATEACPQAVRQVAAICCLNEENYGILNRKQNMYTIVGSYAFVTAMIKSTTLSYGMC